jgi:hypothetical protein
VLLGKSALPYRAVRVRAPRFLSGQHGGGALDRRYKIRGVDLIPHVLIMADEPAVGATSAIPDTDRGGLDPTRVDHGGRARLSGRHPAIPDTDSAIPQPGLHLSATTHCTTLHQSQSLSAGL